MPTSYVVAARREFGLLPGRMGRYGVRAISGGPGQGKAADKTGRELSRAGSPTSGIGPEPAGSRGDCRTHVVRSPPECRAVSRPFLNVEARGIPPEPAEAALLVGYSEGFQDGHF